MCGLPVYTRCRRLSFNYVETYPYGYEWLSPLLNSFHWQQASSELWRMLAEDFKQTMLINILLNVIKIYCRIKPVIKPILHCLDNFTDSSSGAICFVTDILPSSSLSSFDMLPTPPSLKARAICTVKHIQVHRGGGVCGGL